MKPIFICEGEYCRVDSEGIYVFLDGEYKVRGVEITSEIVLNVNCGLNQNVRS